jgi:hypothetical protein
MTKLLLLVTLLLSVSTTQARAIKAQARDEEPRAELMRSYKRTHACPATGRTKGACPGYKVDKTHGAPVWIKQ